MSTQPRSTSKSVGTWLSRWEPEDQAFWSAGGSAIAWRTLALTTVNLTLAFAAWFLVSALSREGTWPIMLEIQRFFDQLREAQLEADAEAAAMGKADAV